MNNVLVVQNVLMVLCAVVVFFLIAVIISVYDQKAREKFYTDCVRRGGTVIEYSNGFTERACQGLVKP